MDFFDEDLAEDSDDGTGPGFQQLAPSNFIEINICCWLWARAAPVTWAVSSGCSKWPPITTHHLSCHGRQLRQMEPEVIDWMNSMDTLEWGSID